MTTPSFCREECEHTGIVRISPNPFICAPPTRGVALAAGGVAVRLHACPFEAHLSFQEFKVNKTMKTRLMSELKTGCSRRNQCDGRRNQGKPWGYSCMALRDNMLQVAIEMFGGPSPLETHHLSLCLLLKRGITLAAPQHFKFAAMLGKAVHQAGRAIVTKISHQIACDHIR